MNYYIRRNLEWQTSPKLRRHRPAALASWLSASHVQSPPKKKGGGSGSSGSGTPPTP